MARFAGGRRLFSNVGPPGGLRGNGVVAVRREDKSRWERRSPLTPEHVRSLVEEGVKVVVQPSTIRIFSDEEYEEAGAVVQEDISVASTILGVKEVPVHKLIPERTFVFFSHTIKAQEYNMPLLDACLDQRIRLIDYERITDDTGKRLVRFGRYAGYAGFIDFIHGLGDRLLALGYMTPLVYLGYAHMYSELAFARRAVADVGKALAKQGLPRELGPMVFVFTGTGDVARGATEIFQALPHKWVQPGDLPALLADDNFDNRVLYGVVASSADCVYRKADPDAPVDKHHYYEHPEEYGSKFASTFGRYATAIVHCAYWDRRFPRFLTDDSLAELCAGRKSRLLGVADLTADRGGALEFVRRITTIDRPFYVYDPETRAEHDNIDAARRGVLIFSVDVLPSEIPVEASRYFGDSLVPFVPQLVHSDGTLPYEKQLEGLGGSLHRAVITSQGKLTPDHAYIADWRQKFPFGEAERAEAAGEQLPSAGAGPAAPGRRVLILGSGNVADSAVSYLARQPGTSLTIASNDLPGAERLAMGRPRAEAVLFTAGPEGASALRTLVAAHDVVISLLPPPMHAGVAEVCIAAGVPLVTSSYVSPEMEALHERARKAGVLILCECGLDPGIDHMLAMEIIDRYRRRGAQMSAFVSNCGGLPSPEAASNALGYKFSWSPAGVLSATSAPATFRYGGELVKLAPGVPVSKAQRLRGGTFRALALEYYPNRDSTPYEALYRTAGPQLRTFFRGTLRYAGFGLCLQAFRDIGLLTQDPVPGFAPGGPRLAWPDACRTLLEREGDTAAGDLESALLRCAGLGRVGAEATAVLVARAIRQCGLLDKGEFVEQTPAGTPLASFCKLLEKHLSYGPRERDAVFLQHLFSFEFPDGREEHVGVSMVEYGDETASAMSRLVGGTVAISTQLVLDHAIGRVGVTRPITADVYLPVLAQLKEDGLCEWKEAPLQNSWVAELELGNLASLQETPAENEGE